MSQSTSVRLNKELLYSIESPQDPTSISSSENDNVDKRPSSEFTSRAMLILISCFFVTFCSVGFVNAFGVFQEYYEQALLSNRSASDISWLGSVNIFCMFGCTSIAGILTDKYGPRFPLCFGSLVMVFALMMMSLSTQYYQLFLTQAVLFGVGISFVILPAMATVSYYYAASRSLAMGITVAGSSLGGVIWPIALHRLLSEVKFGWTIRIAAFMMIPLLGLGCLMMDRPREFANRPKPKADFSIVKNPVIIFLSIGLFLVFLGLFSPLFYIPSYMVSLGKDANLAFYMVSIVNAASLFGRVLPGLLADKTGNYNVLFLVTVFSGLVACCWTKATSVGGIVVFSLAYGLASGSAVTLRGSDRPKEQFGLAMGAVMTFLSISGLIGTPISGQVLSPYGYLGLSLFSGLAMLLGSVFILIARLKIKTGLLVKV
ncbi:MCT family MFS transporter [Aspergillus alliaceus]|uniref:MCT family MFS transporter n=1 Tax=Petromyces alliaceus TaxID=209559 RepID=UPI0012A535B8|nr:putative MFS monocarboxylate transporter [Aspergillus alliaceus]KAB8234861.1 putative MFS monocarboxylate transporter [Aspergillus alliaceus]